MATYDAVHRQCRTLESIFDTKLTTYTRLASELSSSQNQDVEASGSPQRWKDVEMELEELLEKVC
jgi:Golgi SNAP receptor complex protein 1